MLKEKKKKSYSKILIFLLLKVCNTDKFVYEDGKTKIVPEV